MESILQLKEGDIIDNMDEESLQVISNDYLENNINASLKVYLNYLRNYEYINEEDYNFLVNNTGIIIKKPSFFNKVWEKIVKKKNCLFIVVEQRTMLETSTYEDSQESNEKSCEVIKFPEQ